MVSNKFRARLSATAAITGVFLLPACGGGGASAPVILPDPQPAPVPAPAPAPQPTPTPTPDPSPLPSPEIALASTYTDLVAGTANGQARWSDGSGTGAPIAGVQCMGSIVAHTHSLVSIYLNGARMAVPASVGLTGCTYELHTHDRSGVVHVEPNVARDLTLGQFFAVWGQPLSRTGAAGLTGPARFYIIDRETLVRFDGNPADITFGARKEIVIVSGTAPAVLPRYRWPASL